MPVEAGIQEPRIALDFRFQQNDQYAEQESGRFQIFPSFVRRG